jgi:hypothetical protein
VIHTGLGRDAARDQRIGAGRDLLGVEQAHVDVEVEPSLLGRHVAAGDRRHDHARHHVQRRVQSHQRVSAVPVERELDLFTDLGPDCRCVEQVHDAVDALAFAGIDDRNALARGSGEHPCVARLPAAERIEDRSVELDPLLADRDHPCSRALEVCVFSKQQLSRHS